MISGSENLIKDIGKVKNGKFIIGDCSYSRVIIPPLTENLNKPTADLLEQYVSQGGRLILYSIPDKIEGKLNNRLSGILNTNSDQIILLNDSTPGSICTILQ